MSTFGRNSAATLIYIFLEDVILLIYFNEAYIVPLVLSTMGIIPKKHMTAGNCSIFSRSVIRKLLEEE
jgi:hypothetical protein